MPKVNNTPTPIWLILNPATVRNVTSFQGEVAAYASRLGWPQLKWLLTTPDSPGTQQAREAVISGAKLVIAVGGDGTVAAVAAGLSQARRLRPDGRKGFTENPPVPLGIIPQGTGNVFARNIGIPRQHLRNALDIAFGITGRPQASDLGWLRFTDTPGINETEHPFIALAGAGFDGATMAATTRNTKNRLGWPAYVAAALKAHRFHDFPIRIHLATPTTSPTPHKLDTRIRRVKSIVISNIGRLPLIHLAPEADISDGLLDLTLVNTRMGLIGWSALGARMAADYLPESATHLLNTEIRHTKTAALLAQTGTTLRSTARALAHISWNKTQKLRPTWLTTEQTHSQTATTPQKPHTKPEQPHTSIDTNSPTPPRQVPTQPLSTIERTQAPKIRVEFTKEHMVETDGDALRPARSFEVHVAHHAITVMVAENTHNTPE